MSCLACDRIAGIRAGTNPYFVAELPEAFVVLADDQRYEGWSILLLKDHAEHLADLPVDRQTNLFADVAHAAAAVRHAFAPVRINYECLGNGLPHIHWHVIPRYAWDPQPGWPVWVRPVEERAVGVEPDRLRTLVTRMQSTLAG